MFEPLLCLGSLGWRTGSSLQGRVWRSFPKRCPPDNGDPPSQGGALLWRSFPEVPTTGEAGQIDALHASPVSTLRMGAGGQWRLVGSPQTAKRGEHRCFPPPKEEDQDQGDLQQNIPPKPSSSCDCFRPLRCCALHLLQVRQACPGSLSRFKFTNMDRVDPLGLWGGDLLQDTLETKLHGSGDWMRSRQSKDPSGSDWKRLPLQFGGV